MQGFICIKPRRVCPSPRIYSKIYKTIITSFWFGLLLYCHIVHLVPCVLHFMRPAKQSSTDLLVLLRWFLVNPNVKLCLSFSSSAGWGTSPSLNHPLGPPWQPICPALPHSPLKIFDPDKTLMWDTLKPEYQGSHE